MGWSLKKNASTASYAVGKSYRVTKDLVFYAVYKPGIRLFYYSSNGSTLYQTVTVARGQSVTLSGVKNPSGCTMLGWSTQKGKTTSPDYLVGSTFTVSKTTKLYAVMFRHSQETKLSDSDFPDVSTTYSKVIFVGDSRTYQLSETLKAQCSPLVYDRVSFVCKSSSKLDWLQTKGYSRLMQEIGDGGTDDKPIAVIFNHGINDLGDVSSYITYMKKIAPKLQKLHCRLFYMSVNPCNNATLLDRKDTASRPEAAVRSFNAAIRTSLCSSGLFTYINTYSMLTNTGYSMNSGSGYDDGYDDGLHYTTVTSKRIYAYCLKTILAL
jgi:hypothetical protein